MATAHEVSATQPVIQEDEQRNLKGLLRKVVFISAVAFSLFQLWANSLGLLTSMKHSGIFLAFTLALVFLLYPAQKNDHRIRWFDYLLSCLGIVVGLYVVFRVDALLVGKLQGIPSDYILGTLAILLVLEATRRAIGLWLVAIPVIFIAYALFGNYIPGIFGHYGFSAERFLIRMYLLDEGLFGVTMRVAATYIFMFILFGAFLEKSGVGSFFNRLALLVSGGSWGGPAKVAVFSSGLMGTISGSAVANVATTGTFTIPLMKRTGYRAEFAGAVEAASSTGGLLAPPIMGSAAFLMAEILGIPYKTVMIAALIPAVLYYLAIYLMVHFEAKKHNLRGLPKEELPKARDVLKQLYIVLPLIVIIVTIISGKTPLYSAFLGIISTILISQLNKVERINFRKFIDALEVGAKSALSVSIACIVAGIIVGVVTMTGVGQVLTYNILAISNNNLLFALALVTVTTIFLTMGLPATAAYIIVASVTGPALIEMGVLPLAAHFFVFYFSSLSNITPPVALASYTAASLSGSNPSSVAWLAMRLTLAGFIVPFMFVYAPELLMINVVLPGMLFKVVTAIIGVFALAIGIIGFFQAPVMNLERALFIIAGFTLMIPENITDIIGIVLFSVLLLRNYYLKRKLEQGITVNS